MNILFLAYYFPPDSSSGAFRPLFFANNLVELGAQVHILTACVEDYLPAQCVDAKLLDKMHSTVRISRCRVWRPREGLISLRNRMIGKYPASSPTPPAASLPATTKSRWQTVKDVITEIVATPDPHIGWLPHCIRLGTSIIAEKRPDAIYATGSPWSGLLAGALLKKFTGVPLVLDFRDPWTSNPTRVSSCRILRILNEKLERAAVRAADGIIANTSTLRDDFLSKYPFLDARRIITITNGFEEPPLNVRRGKNACLNIVHSGELYLSRNPVPLLTAVGRIVDQGHITPAEIRIHFVGGNTFEGSELAQLLSSEPLRDIVRTTPRVSYDEAREISGGADVLLLVQPDLPLQVPRKLYEYMALRKPILCVAEPEGATGRLVRENDLGYVCNNSVHEIESTLLRLITDWKQGTLEDIADGRCDRFRNRELSKELHSFIEGLVNGMERACP
jgi:glycosyl transferase family 4/glycosyl transferase family 1